MYRYFLEFDKQEVEQIYRVINEILPDFKDEIQPERVEGGLNLTFREVEILVANIEFLNGVTIPLVTKLNEVLGELKKQYRLGSFTLEEISELLTWHRHSMVEGCTDYDNPLYQKLNKLL